MDFKNAAMKLFTGEEQEEMAVEEYAGPRLLQSGHLNIMVRTPKSFTDVREYADHLLNGCSVLIGFDAVDTALQNRIFDYMNGIAYICEANVSAINDTMIIYTPRGVAIDKQAAAKRSGGISWLG